jgi:hypothetical protein
MTAVFLLLAVSGCVCYCAPRCRDANWGGWNVWGLGKDEWVALHMASAATFLVVSVAHVVLNWRVLAGYLKLNRNRNLRYVRECIGAVGIAAAVLILAATMLPPVGSLEAFAEQRKEQFAEALRPAAPWRHAEETPLAEFADRLDVPLKAVLRALNTGGPPAAGDDSLHALARRRGTTPQDLYRQLRHGLGKCTGGSQDCRSGRADGAVVP